jgi:predicted transcriptional regulator
MGQKEVYAVFEKNPDKWISSIDVGKALNLPRNSVCVALRQLRYCGFLDWEYRATENPKKRGQRGTFSYYYKLKTEKLK